MTRKAKERRQERVLEKQRARERHAQREQQLSVRADWRALLRRIDGDDQAAVSPRHRLRPHEQAALEAAAADASAKRAAAAAAAAAPVADTVQWKSTHVPVAAASVFHLPIKVDAPRATLAYAFSTQELDINFGVQAIGASDGAMHELVPTARYESQLQRVRGSLVLAGPAMVLLVWDNSFSWLNAKQLAYEVELRQEFPVVEPPPQVETAATPTQRAALALHERAKRERLRAHREASSEALEAAMLSHDKQRALLEHQIEELRRKLEETEALKVKAAQEKEVVEDEIDALAWEIDALLWRSMGSVVIEKIFSFCSERELSAWSLTSHQWHTRIASYRDVTARIAAAGDPTIAA